MNELRIFESNDDQSRAGFRTILAGAEHSDYANFVRLQVMAWE